MSTEGTCDLMIIDDEVLETEYILTLLNQCDIQFSNVAVAFSMEMAQNILLNRQIDIMICDIEMPRGSGLDLLKWVREQGFSPEVIIATCHPNFTYAQTALQLSCSDYLLKPVTPEQLESSLHKALDAVKRKASANLYQINERGIWENFFTDFIQNGFLHSRDGMLRKMREIHFPLTPETQMVPLLFRFSFRPNRTKSGVDSAKKTVLINILSDVLFDFSHTPFFCFINESTCFVAFPVSAQHGKASGNFYEHRLKKLLQSSNNLLGMPMCCYVGLNTPFQELNLECKKLCEKSREIFTCMSQVVLPSAEPKTLKTEFSAQEEDWAILLENGMLNKVKAQVEECLDPIYNQKIVCADEIFMYSQALIRAIFYFMEKQCIDDPDILSEQTQNELLMRDSFFLEDYSGRVRKLFKNLDEKIMSTGMDKHICERVALYIQSHVEDDMDRTMLAHKFGLSPEYLSHLFKQVMGISLVHFITREKLLYCKRMFDITSCSIHVAAEKVGYTNFSYFAKIFKKEFGCTPQQYKDRKEGKAESTIIGAERSD